MEGRVSPTPDYDRVTSDYTRLLLVFYTLIMMCSGVLANAFVVSLTFRYRSFRLDKWGLIFARNLSAADGLYSLLIISPILVTNLSKYWCFGPALCRAGAALRLFLLLSSVNFVTTISIHRMIQGIRPLRDYNNPASRFTTISLMIWLYSFVLSLRFLVGSAPSMFSVETGFCEFNFSVLHVVERYLYVSVLLIAPTAIVMTSHIVLCHVSRTQIARRIQIRKVSVRAHTTPNNTVRKRKDRGMKRTFLTLGALSSVILVSWVPNIAHMLGGTSLPDLYGRLATYLFFTNSVGNPILYTLVNRDFKNFARRRIVSAISRDVNGIQNTGPGGTIQPRTVATKLNPFSFADTSFTRPCKSALV
eukprot:sb/3466014/